MTINENLDELYSTKKELEKNLQEINETIKKQKELQKLKKHNKKLEDIKKSIYNVNKKYLETHNLAMLFDFENNTLIFTPIDDSSEVLLKLIFLSPDEMKKFINDKFYFRNQNRIAFINRLLVISELNKMNAYKYEIDNNIDDYYITFIKTLKKDNLKVHTRLSIFITQYENEVSLCIYQTYKGKPQNLENALRDKFDDFKYNLSITDSYYDDTYELTNTKDLTEEYIVDLGYVKINNITQTIKDVIEKLDNNSKLIKLFQ